MRTSTCAVCGEWLDDIEKAATPQDRCWDHKNTPVDAVEVDA